MSWSNSWMGKVEAIKAAMGRYREQLTGNSQAEFDEARPHLEGLLNQNTNGAVVHLDANGHAYTNSEGQRIARCSMSLKQIGYFVE